MAERLEAITDNDELEDGIEETPFRLTEIDAKLLASPVVLRSLGGIAIGLAVLVWPNRSDLILARLTGIGLMWLAVTSVRAMARVEQRNWVNMATVAAMLAVGGALLLNPDRSTVFMGRLLGLLLVGYAAHGAYKTVRTSGHDRGRLAVYGLVAAAGLVLSAFTEDVIATSIAVGALCWIAVSAVNLAVSLDARTSGNASSGDTIELAADWLRDRPKSVDARQALYDKILYEGPATQIRVVRFFTLMGFAAVIASMGVITDSTAVVIGAMLVAPLMTPLMGMAISLVMGWPNRLSRSAAIASGGIIFAIAIGVLLGLVAPTVIDTTSNTQILARTSPTALDLITAVAAGAAGAYGLSRPDVSDSLPGVAIAISLVPPLTVVGIAYSQGDWTAGNGALLLFATNMIAILLVGGITFVLTGVTPVRRVTENQHRVRTAVGVTAIAAVLVFGALLINGAQIASDTLQQSTVESTIDRWLGNGTPHRLVTADIDGDDVSAVVIGPSQGLPAIETLADQLGEDLDKPITVNLSLVVEERLTASGG